MGTRPSQDTLHFKSFSMSSLGSISTFSSISTWLVALLAQKLCPVPKSPDYKNSKSLPKPSKNTTRAQPSTPQTTNLTQKDHHKSKKKLCLTSTGRPPCDLFLWDWATSPCPALPPAARASPAVQAPSATTPPRPCPPRCAAACCALRGGRCRWGGPGSWRSPARRGGAP